jgi:hypothetical protein
LPASKRKGGPVSLLGTAFAHCDWQIYFTEVAEVAMDALELLKQDHERVKELFERGQQIES